MADGLVPTATLTGYVGQDSVFSFCLGTRILSSAMGNPCVITTCDANGVAAPHGLRTGQIAYIVQHVGSTPVIADAYIVTVLTPNTFSIPVSCDVAGAEGFVTALTSTIAGYTWVLTIKDSDTNPTFTKTISGIIADADNREFNFPVPAATTATIPVSASHKYDIWRTNTGFAQVYGDGVYVQKTERRVTPP